MKNDDVFNLPLKVEKMMGKNIGEAMLKDSANNDIAHCANPEEAETIKCSVNGYDKLKAELENAEKMFEQSEQQKTILREALEFYADEDNYDDYGVFCDIDNGEIARTALKKIKQTEEK